VLPHKVFHTEYDRYGQCVKVVIYLLSLDASTQDFFAYEKLNCSMLKGVHILCSLYIIISCWGIKCASFLCVLCRQCGGVNLV